MPQIYKRKIAENDLVACYIYLVPERKPNIRIYFNML